MIASGSLFAPPAPPAPAPAPPAKRRLSPPVASAPKKARTVADTLPGTVPALAAVKDKEKRVTRSSLGGSGDSDAAGGAGGEGSAPIVYLPANTLVLLTVQDLPNLVYHPVVQLDASSDAPPPAESSSTLPPPKEEPTFRLLESWESFGKSRSTSVAEVDTSDAYYHRLHRFPEVLEKRSARLERDRLIHERSKLILEIEEMRGRGWVYHGSQGGKGEAERRRKLSEGEERLKRYDALLPNQPRKSNFLNNGPHPLATSSLAAGSNPNSRANSPATALHRRHSTPVSASGDGSTTIRIKFSALGGGRNSSSHARAKKGKARYVEMDDEDDSPSESEDESEDEGRYVRRDRKAETARAKERTALGLPTRGSMAHLEAARGHRDGKIVGKKRKKRNDEMGRDSEAEEEDDDLESGSDTDPRRKARRSSGSRRLTDSFFTSEALRDKFILDSTSKRRSSGRVIYAFGQRLPDVALERQAEFVLFGGTASSNKRRATTHERPLDELVKDRIAARLAQEGGIDAPTPPESFVIYNGVSVPSSSIAALTNTPLKAIAPKPRSLPLPYISPPRATPSSSPPSRPSPSSAPTAHSHGTRKAKLPVIGMSPSGRMEVITRID